MSSPKPAALEVDDLTVAYQDNIALSHTSLSLPTGEALALLGPNGAGKSTLMKAILGLIPTLTGSVQIFGKPLNQMRRRIGYMPQAADVDWDYPATVGDVVAQGTFGRLGWFKHPGTAEKQIVRESLETVGIAKYADRHITELSGGQKQRTFMARILAQRPDFLFMDEPFAGVDAASERTLMSVLDMLVSEGKTLVIVHHNLASVADICTWACLLAEGKVVSVGPLAEAFTTETVHTAYGISDDIFTGAR